MRSLDPAGMKWLEQAAAGICLAQGRPGVLYLSGYTLARSVDPVAGRFVDLSGHTHRVLGAITTLGPLQYQMRHTGVSTSEGTLIAPKPNAAFGRPDLGALAYITNYATEVSDGHRLRVLSEVEDVLDGVCDIAEVPPDPALLMDPDQVPWHFIADGRFKIGFKSGAMLDRLGLTLHPLTEAAAPDAVRVDTTVPYLARKPRYRPSTLSFQKNAAFARIKYYTDDPNYAGVHEYCVDCLGCQRRSDLPSQVYAPENLRFRCPYCGDVFAVEYVRTGLSLRTRGW